MEIIYARNVNDAYAQGINLIRKIGIPSNSRAGDVLVADTPVMTVYNNPTERVLFDKRRDANPFFHLFESLWMLAGMNDATWLDRFVKDFSSRFAEPGGEMWGAYGYRWRKSYDIDQLDVAIERLSRNPDDRRVVIAMWDPSYDCLHPDEISVEPRDLPCNTHLYPRIRSDAGGMVMDLTICCRSNDIIWGAYGANAVHFSMLLEYLAGRCGVGIGRMYQFSNNWHAYKDVLGRMGEPSKFFHPTSVTSTLPIGIHWEHWDNDLWNFMRWTENYQNVVFSNSWFEKNVGFRNSWFEKTVCPMWDTHQLWRRGNYVDAFNRVRDVSVQDWWLAADQWMRRRIKI